MWKFKIVAIDYLEIISSEHMDLEILYNAGIKDLSKGNEMTASKKL